MGVASVGVGVAFMAVASVGADVAAMGVAKLSERSLRLLHFKSRTKVAHWTWKVCEFQRDEAAVCKALA